MKTVTTFAVLSLSLCYASAIQADTFGSGSNEFGIEFVTIGNPGNADDTTGNPNPAGKVDYTYRMGQFEISEDMIDKANTLGGLDLTHNNRGANKPATAISWFEAAQFVSWLNTSTGSTPAYKFDVRGVFQLWLPGDAGYNPNNRYRNSQARYFLPSMDEWYKAAYHDEAAGTAATYFNYPTGSDTAPTPVASGTDADTAVYSQSGLADITLTGGLSPYGTMGQGGNVREWEETDFDLLNDSTGSARGNRGGFWSGSAISLLSPSSRGGNIHPSNGTFNLGFRVASAVPEPTTLTLATLTLATLSLLAIAYRPRS